MNKRLKEKIMEALTSVLPITAIVLVLSVWIDTPIGTIIMFLTGALLLILGMGFFQLGADIAMMPLGEKIGIQFTKMKKLGLIIAISFVMGLIITIAEPDLQVLAEQVPSINSTMLIWTVAIGVGIFLVLAVLRILFRFSLSRLLIICYLAVFGLAALAPDNFVAVAFDSGGVTTGPITVPFILALGLGLASIRSDKGSQDDSFGFVAICSVGPILAVLILGIIFNPQEASYAPAVIPDVDTARDVVLEFAHYIPEYGREVLVALVPIFLFFCIFQMFTRRFSRSQMIRIIVGFVYTFLGLMLFLTGVNVGFIPVGSMIGSQVASGEYYWALVPIGMAIGYFIVAVEPAVHVLNKQVEEVSGGAISHKVMNLSLSVGIAIALAISMLRIIYQINIMWILIPGYAIALGLTFFVPKIFTGIAFDSGGVASGPMTSTFLLPFAIGACEGIGGNVLTDAFGVVAMVAMTPLIAVQVVGFVTAQKAKKAARLATESLVVDDDIILEDDSLTLSTTSAEKAAVTAAVANPPQETQLPQLDGDDFVIIDDSDDIILVKEGEEPSHD